MRLGLVAHVVGSILRAFAALLVVPFLIDLGDGRTAEALGFLATGVVTALAGQGMRRLTPGGGEMLRIEGVAVVAATWLFVAGFGAIPYVWSGLSPIDAFFESMSGFTTTGATVFRDFDAFSRGTFLWRALTQWLGGLGVIALSAGGLAEGAERLRS